MISFTTLTQVFDLYELAYQYYRYKPGLLAIDTGFRYVDNKPTEETVVRVHFQGRAPAEIQKPAGGETIQLFFFKNKGNKPPEQRKMIHWRKQMDVLQPGISFGYSSPGSLGLLGYDRRRNPSILTCAHIFADKKDPHPPVYQPAPAHQGRYDNQIGHVAKFHTKGDVAIVNLERNIMGDNVLFNGKSRRYRIKTLRKVRLGDILIKSGCRTGITHAIVDGIGSYFPRKSEGRKAIRVFRLVPLPNATGIQREISNKGDSGAIWIDPNSGAGVGLHIAGEVDPLPANEFAFALHLNEVCSEMKFRMKK